MSSGPRAAQRAKRASRQTSVRCCRHAGAAAVAGRRGWGPRGPRLDPPRPLTDSSERMEVARTTTSGCSSQKSSASVKYLTPREAARSWYGERDVAMTCHGGQGRSAEDMQPPPAAGRAHSPAGRAGGQPAKHTAPSPLPALRCSHLVPSLHHALGQELAKGAKAHDADLQPARAGQTGQQAETRMNREAHGQAALFNNNQFAAPGQNYSPHHAWEPSESTRRAVSCSC